MNPYLMLADIVAITLLMLVFYVPRKGRRELVSSFLVTNVGVLALAGLMAFLGHLFPVFLGFKGGKGVATAAGVLIGANGWLGLATLGVWLGVAFTLRYSSLAALCAALAAPAVAFALGLGTDWVIAIGVMSALLIWRHKDNIKRLMAGQESRIGSKKKNAAGA